MVKTRTALAILAAAVSASTARATITFNLIGLSTIDPQAAAGFQQAANRWTNSLDVTNPAGQSTNITINLQVGFTSLGANVLGQSASTTVSQDFSNYKSSLSNHSTSADDALAISALPSGSTFAVYLNRTTNNPNGSGSATPYVDSSTDLSSFRLTNRVRSTYANYRALGVEPATDSQVDAQITFSSDFSFDFNPADGIDSGKTDFVGVATHEIGHALGFASGSTDLDYSVGHDNVVPNQDSIRAYPLDLFRYSTDSTGLSAIDLSTDTRGKYLSFDKGATAIANFSTGQFFGDGFQASHWKETVPTLGLMDPGLAAGEVAMIGSLDRRAFDILGYKLITTWKWTDTSSSFTSRWSNATQWSADGITDNTISAVFANNTAGAYTVSIDTPSVVKDITIANDNVTFNLTNSTLTSGTVNIGQLLSNISTLTVQKISAGQFNTGNINVGAVAGSIGRFNIQGNGIVSATGALAVAPVATSVGTVTVGAGTLSMTGDLSVGGTSSAAGGIGTLAVNNGGVVNVGGNFKLWGTAGTSAAVSGGSLTVTGATTVSSGSTLAVSLGAFKSNGMAVAGTYNQSGGNASAGAITGAGSATVSAGTLTANQITLGALSVPGTGRVLMTANGTNTGTSRLSSLSITSNGQFDLNDNDLILDYSGSSPATTIRSYLSSAFNVGGWDGVGLASLAAHNNASQGTALGYADSSTLGINSFDGQFVDNTTTLVKYTYYGDSNLDGTVNIADFTMFLDGFASGGSTWAQGDYTYDGKIDLGNDFNLFVDQFTNHGGTLGTLENSIELSPALSTAQRATLLAIVPEPSMGVLGLVFGCGLLARRRRGAASY